MAPPIADSRAPLRDSAIGIKATRGRRPVNGPSRGAKYGIKKGRRASIRPASMSPPIMPARNPASTALPSEPPAI
jgi:hypothetical protein